LLLLTYTFKADKQFYLDQAKRLKETFNSRYPDYVYRRRPNNSRKKRRPDATTNPLLDPSTTGDTGDDFPVAHDFDYQSVDGQDPARDLAPSRGSSHAGMASGYGDNSGGPSPHATISPYGYPTNEYSASHIPASGPRLPHLSSIHVHDHPPSGAPSLASLPSHHYADTSMHSHGYPSHASQPSANGTSSSTCGPDHIAGSSLWGNVRSDHGRTMQPTWTTAPPVIPPLSDQIRERGGPPTVHTKTEVYSDPSPRPWSTPTSQASPAISSASSHVSSQSSNGYPLQTLSSPFFPPSHSPGAYQSSASSSSTPSGSPENYYSSGSQLQGSSYGGRAGGGYEQATIYNSHPVLHSSISHHPSSAHEMLQVPQSQARPSRPSLHSLTLEPGMPPLGPPSSAGGSYTNTGMDHWRAKISGQ
jgi:transcription factor SOX1/3/14/21 (SOX group B)/transcription factor SOX9 (SOX group E)